MNPSPNSDPALSCSTCGAEFTHRADHQCQGPFPASWWSEEDGDVLWWAWKDGDWLGEAPYVGSPLDLGQTVEIHVSAYKPKMHRLNVGEWPGYHTHWTRLPAQPPAPSIIDDPEED